MLLLAFCAAWILYVILLHATSVPVQAKNATKNHCKITSNILALPPVKSYENLLPEKLEMHIQNLRSVIVIPQ